MRVVAFLCVLFLAFAASAQVDQTVHVGQVVKNAYGIVLGMETGDIACTLTLRDENGATFREMAEFDICDRRSMLLNRRVALHYAVETIVSPDCRGNLECHRSISAVVVNDASPTAN